MKNRSFIFLFITLLVYSGAAAQHNPNKKVRRAPYEEVDFEDMMHRYFAKEKISELEGIYSVSCVIIKTNKKFLSKREKIRVVERKDNYARIAILKDWPGSKRDYIEVSLSFRDAKKYPIVGQLSILSEGQGLIYDHIEPDGTKITFSMMTESSELLEAEYSEMQKRKIITYKLSYLKVYPKSNDLVYIER
jgi:hypothetical protein